MTRVVAAFWLLVAGAASALGQAGNPAAPQSHVSIPFLANDSKPNDLDFQGGECDVDRTGNTMTCEFQQVFVTNGGFPPQTCLITTSRYARVFRKQTATQWIAGDPPAGVCGISTITTLAHDGGVRWTMELKTIVTHKDASPECRAIVETSEILGWQNIRRPLPCTFVQPGGLSPGGLAR